MVVKDARNVRTGTKSLPERSSLRRLSSLEKNKGVRKNPSEKMAAKIFEELEEINGGVLDKVVVGVSNPTAKTQNRTQARTPPHYQLPTVNSSKQARVQSKPLTPSPDFARVRRFSLGLDKSPGACKYESRDIRRSSLGAKGGGLRSPNTVLKPCKAVEKTPVNHSRLKHLGGGEKTQTLKSPSSSPRLQSVTLKAARATCSSSCKHVVRGGDLKIEAEPRCPYLYCSLNHLHRESSPPLKQFLASRRRLLRTQKSFKWIGLAPVPKESIDRGDGVETSSAVDTGQDFYVVGHGKDVAGEDDVLMVTGKMDDGLSPSLEDSQIVDCDDYDDGHSTGDVLVSELGENHEFNQIEIVEHLVDELKAKAMDEEPYGAEDDDIKYGAHELGVEACPGNVDVLMSELSENHECNQIEIVEHLVDEFNGKAMDEEPFKAEDDDFKYGAHELGVEACPGDVHESVEEFAEDEDLRNDNHELEVETPPDVDMSTEEFVKDEDVTHDNYEIEHEPTDDNSSIKISRVSVAESAFEARSEESTKLPADNEDVGDSELEFDVEASASNDNHELEVEAPPDVDMSTEEFVKDEDVRHGNYEIEHEPTDDNGSIKISSVLVAESDFEARSDESTKFPADNEDVGDSELDFDVEASASNFYGYGQIDDTQEPCFIKEYTHRPQCSLITEHDGLPHESFSAENDDISESQDAEALSIVDGVNCKDQLEGFVEDYDPIEETGQRCFIQLHVLGAENSDHTEPDSPQVESYSEVNSGVKDGVPEGCDCVSASSDGGSRVTDHAEQPAGYVNGQIEDTEHCCFIQVNSFGNERNGNTGSDCLPSQVEEKHHTTSSSSECGSISQVGASVHIGHASGSVSQHDQIQNSEQQCLIWLNAQVTESSSHEEPNEPPYAPLPDTNSCIKDEIKGDYGFASGNLEDGSAYQIGINDVIEHDNNKSNELDSSSTSSGETKCYILVDTNGMQCNREIEFDSPPNNSVVDTNANSSSKQDSQEECIPITRDLFDVFDDDYNLTSLFAECSDEINFEIESHWPVQFDSSASKFSISSNFDDDIDETVCEFNVSTKSEGEDSHNLTSGDEESVSEIYDNDVEKHYLEWELLENECSRTTDEYGDGHAKDTNLSQPLQVETCGAHYTIQLEPGNWDDILFDLDVASNSDAREEYHDSSEMSSNESGTECKKIKKELKKLRSISEKNENKPYRLKFRQGRVHPFLDQLSEAEKVDLRHQMIEERRASHEWMVDYALTKIVKKLSPFRKRKVELLVEAFETVIPLSKCETDLPHATSDSTCRRPIQACN